MVDVVPGQLPWWVAGPGIGLCVVALYARSIYLAGDAYPWLLDLHRQWSATPDLELIRALLAAQNPASADASGTAILRHFHDLLAGLIGASLTDQLLGSGRTAPSTTDKDSLP